MPGLRVLFLGGTGVISSACSRQAVERGIELFVLNRGQTTGRPLPSQSTVQDDISVFRGRAGQFVFISSASAYQTPPSPVPVVESTPLRNPYLQYSRDKIECGELLRTAYRGGAREVVAWYDEDPARQRIDAGVDAVTGKLAQAFRPGA